MVIARNGAGLPFIPRIDPVYSRPLRAPGLHLIRCGNASIAAG
ncbi:hypothetical protein BSU04_22225 [Caballeronia sordidicola]|uniref:Uncharacterized protein n=1 Tax=Caballeronia sordidicola TaxID=196367 RepID=A0A226WYU0_CABSO|nr:hypothetical protein BSU04_22225 [Caballeronia sordidicola]